MQRENESAARALLWASGVMREIDSRRGAAADCMNREHRLVARARDGVEGVVERSGGNSALIQLTCARDNFVTRSVQASAQHRSNTAASELEGGSVAYTRASLLLIPRVSK